MLRSRIVNGVNSTFVGYGPETLTQPKTFYPGVSSFNGYGAHFALELNQAPKTTSVSSKEALNGEGYIDFCVILLHT